MNVKEQQEHEKKLHGDWKNWEAEKRKNKVDMKITKNGGERKTEKVIEYDKYEKNKNLPPLTLFSLEGVHEWAEEWKRKEGQSEGEKESVSGEWYDGGFIKDR